MAREVLSNGVINPDKYQADWYADLSNNWNLLNDLIGSAISSSEVDSKIATAIQELMIRTFQIVAELPATGTEGVMYLVLIPNTSKYTAYVWENNAYRELGVIQMTITIDDELSTTSENPAQNKVITNALNNKAPISHTHSASDITSGLATVATSGSYNDLSNTPTIPTVNNATLTIQKNGTNVQTFTANQSTNATANITVPTKTSDLTNDSGFITSDNTKIPLAGSNQISGSLIPATDNSIDVGSSTKNLKMLYTKGVTIDGTQFLPSDYVTLNDAQTIPGNKTFSGLTKTTGKYPYSYSENDLNNAIYNMETTYWMSDTANRPPTSYYGTVLSLNREVNVHTSSGIGWMAQFGIGTDSRLYLRTKTNLGEAWENWKEFITINEVIPRSGGAVLTGDSLGRTVNTGTAFYCGGTDNGSGACVILNGKDTPTDAGRATIQVYDGTNDKYMRLNPDGTWTWTGQAVQLISDQRLKQQIAEIDDKLLDAWEDVEPVQFKYNDAVKEKSDNARLHTGYVVQQIDEACKSHGVDVSKYGLYCHEEYAEETREIEHDDGTKTTEVVRPANEHYSLRYTEALIVECAYLRKKLKELTARIEQLESSK